MASPCANEPSFLKVRDLAQLVKALVAYWLGTLSQVAGSYPGGSMKISHVQWLLIFMQSYNSHTEDVCFCG